MDNLFDQPDDLDPQPEFPLRTNPTFYKDDKYASPDYGINSFEENVMSIEQYIQSQKSQDFSTEKNNMKPSFPSMFPCFKLLCLLWLLGLCLWYVMYYAHAPTLKGMTTARRKRIDSFKDV